MHLQGTALGHGNTATAELSHPQGLGAAQGADVIGGCGTLYDEPAPTEVEEPILEHPHAIYKVCR